MQNQRQVKRVDVDIPVMVATVLETVEASIADLTEWGAQILGVGLPAGTRFRIEYRGQTVFAQCRWSEIDRMGIKFLFELNDGPLHERLIMARLSQMDDDAPVGMHVSMAHGSNTPSMLGARTFGRAAPSGSFGRRS